MKGKSQRITPFWKEELKAYIALHETPIAPHAVPHANYQDPPIMLKQSFNEQLPSCWPKFYDALYAEEGSVCWLTMEPGEVIPVHKELLYKIDDFSNIVSTIKPERMTKVFARILKKISSDPEKKSLYSLRHTFATNLIANGVLPEIVSVLRKSYLRSYS